MSKRTLNGTRYDKFEITVPVSNEVVTIYANDKIFCCKKENIEYIAYVNNAQEIKEKGELE